MNRNFLEHHVEFMEALRADFDREWLNEEYRLRNRGLSPKEIFWAQVAAWNVIVSLESRR